MGPTNWTGDPGGKPDLGDLESGRRRLCLAGMRKVDLPTLTKCHFCLDTGPTSPGAPLNSTSGVTRCTPELHFRGEVYFRGQAPPLQRLKPLIRRPFQGVSQYLEGGWPHPLGYSLLRVHCTCTLKVHYTLYAALFAPTAHLPVCRQKT